MCILQTRTYVKGGSTELKFEGVEILKWNIPNDRAKTVDEKLGHLSGYHIYSWNYGHKNVKSSSSSFVFSVDDSKMSRTVSAKYVGASERSYIVLSENSMDCWILMVINKMSTLENAGFQYFFADLTVTPKHTILERTQ